MSDDNLESNDRRPNAVSDISRAAVLLLKGVVSRDGEPTDWTTILERQSRLRDYLSVLGLDLVIDEAEGYAFVRSHPTDDDAEDSERGPVIPRLMARRALSFPVSLLLALLRKRLAEFDARGGETRLVLSRQEIVELVRVFLPERADETRLFAAIDAHITKVVELGFLKRLGTAASSSTSFEVRRTIKAFVDAQWLTEFDAKLTQYRESLSRDIERDSNGDAR